jgi:Flp pilus assembly protein TadG
MLAKLRLSRSVNARKGNSLIEFSLLMPWYFFLFVGAYDCGFYGYALIALEDGVRVAALNASQNSTLAASADTACTYVLGSLQNLPNIGSSVTTCSASPITVTATYGATSGPDGGPLTTVSAVYTSPQLIPIPSLLPGQITITRTLEMRVQGP